MCMGFIITSNPFFLGACLFSFVVKISNLSYKSPQSIHTSLRSSLSASGEKLLKSLQIKGALMQI